MKTIIEIQDWHKDGKGYRVDFVDATGWGNRTHVSNEDLIEHCIANELNMHEYPNAEMCDIEQGYDDPETVLHDDPKRILQSYLEENYPC